jgi:hypothetical protein
MIPLPLPETVKLALFPAHVVWLAGWVVIATDVTTVSVAALEVAGAEHAPDPLTLTR